MIFQPFKVSEEKSDWGTDHSLYLYTSMNWTIKPQQQSAQFLYAKEGSIDTNVNNLSGNHSFASAINTTTHAAVGNKNIGPQLAAIKIQLLTQTKFLLHTVFQPASRTSIMIIPWGELFRDLRRAAGKTVTDPTTHLEHIISHPYQTINNWSVQ